MLAKATTRVSIVDTRAAFFAAMSRLQREFAAAAADIDAREAALKEAIADIRHVLEDGIGETVFDRKHPLARFATDFNGEVTNIVQEWLKRIETHDRNTAFRKGHTDRLVVFVLGKVKAGKSSLGNYIAYGCSNPDRAPIAEPRPEFFTAVMAKGAEDQTEAASGPRGYFRVDACEATKSIQGFRIPGLTWVDSPGLHSVTPENEALASDYADVADLIVYPMHSGSPGRIGDIKEILGFLGTNKRFLVAITQSDKMEEDETPDGEVVRFLVMKNRAARQQQIDHVRDAVAAAGHTSPFDILSLSVRYAETNDNDPAALEESGVADFYRLLTEIARSEGVRHKRDTPSRNLDHFVELVLGSGANTLAVKRVFAQLRELEKKLAATSGDLDCRANRVTAAVIGKIGPAVDEALRSHADDKDQAGFERKCKEELHRIVHEETRKELRSLLTAKGGERVPDADLAKIPGIMAFQDITLKVPKSNREALGAVGGALGSGVGGWGGAAAGTALLPGIGTAVGALLGAFFGSAFGTGAGEALGSDWDESMRSGDNRAEVEASAKKALREAGQAAVEDFFSSIKSVAIMPVYRCAHRLDQGLMWFSTDLKTRVHSSGRSRPISKVSSQTPSAWEAYRSMLGAIGRAEK